MTRQPTPGVYENYGEPGEFGEGVTARRADDVTVQTSHLGLSLRDWFAGQAIPAIIERCGADPRQPHEHITDYFARKAYEVADAMLIARKGGET